jgi:hypothetical protein
VDRRDVYDGFFSSDVPFDAEIHLHNTRNFCKENRCQILFTNYHCLSSSFFLFSMQKHKSSVIPDFLSNKLN